MEGSGTDGRKQAAGSNDRASNASLVDQLDVSAPRRSKRKPSSRPPKFLNAMDRRTENGMIVPAPPPVIRTEENDPTPSLPSVVAAVQRKNHHKTKLPPKKKQRLDTTQQTQPPPPIKPKAASKRDPKLPETPAQAEKWDKMLWEKKLEGKGWREIAEEWERLTDTTTEITDQIKESDAIIKRRQLIDRLAVRFVMLKENYAASGTMEASCPSSLTPLMLITLRAQLPDSYYEAHPHDLKYQYISNRKRQDVKLIRIMDKTKAQLDEKLWETFCRNYKEDEGLEISVTEARRRYEALINGVRKLKPTASEEKDMIKVKKEIRREPVAIKHEDDD
ncbi:hypothetical protein G647_00307 [Cladophialophora carrionii CBS 160.54]|uniref:Uncharacterized protein n=1 Tax=Cladophialophora carrionii CBS 160.54 TaxID=1279043 RepID=V9DNI8_9EURO|nr:uncharacterized protein G647_00307 [Cladophialophora carrionii CBS 160.54]ETI27858.1 hypothetical protein G647_00307 [Cladophialophora carrionii CBS 160.54]